MSDEFYGFDDPDFDIPEDVKPAPDEPFAACPFCGGADQFVERATLSASYVMCNDCGARGPDCDPEHDGDDDEGRSAAIRAWNKREARSV
jgi:Lar family restriction alleviation protein